MAFKKLTAGLMASSMILGLATTAAAEITTATPFETAVKMNKLGIVVGNGTNPDGSIDFNLGGNLTRAELVTTIVRSFGAEQAAQLAKGAPSFADVASNEWFSGYVAVAKNLAEQAGTTIGRDANTFDPNAQVSKAEALVFVMKYLGVKVSSTGANWYEAWIAKAVELGMISEADAAIALANPGSPATRGEAFVILDFGYSAKVLEGGASLYTAFVDSTKPTVEASAAETTAEKTVTVSGKVSDNKGVAAVFVNGTAVEVKDGNFSAEVEVKVGKNTIEVSATDVAGNSQSKTLTVTRANAAAEAIEAADVTVVAGGEASVAAKLVDANGAEIADAEIEGTSDLGTFAGGKFTAGTKSGEGKLTLKAGEITKEVTVKVTAAELDKVVASKTSVGPNEAVTLVAQDAYGNEIADATYSQESADAFLVGSRFLATKGGTYTVSATAGGKTVSSTVAVYGAVSAFKVEAPNTAVANGQTEYTFTVKAVDANGAVVGNYETDIDAITGISIPAGLTEVSTKRKEMANGVATYVYKVSTSLANTRITARFSAGTITGAANVDVAAQVPTEVSLSTPSGFLPNNSRTAGTDVTVEVLDQAGKPMDSGVWNMDVTLTGPVSLSDSSVSKSGTKLISTVSPSDSFKIYPEAAGEAGDVTVSVAFTGLKTGTKNLKAQFAQAAANIVVQPVAKTEVTSSKIATPSSVEFEIFLTDKNGVPVETSSPEYTVTFTGVSDKAKVFADGAGSAVYDGFANLNTTLKVQSDSKGKATIKVGGEKAESFTFTVAATGLTTSAAQTVTVKPAAASTVGFTTNTALSVLRADKNVVTLEAAVKDAQGNAVPVAGTELKFQASSYDGVTLNGKAADFTAKTDENGKATVELEMAAYLPSVQISIADPDGTGPITVSGGATTVSLVNTVPASIAVELRNNVGVIGSWTAGATDTLTIRAIVKDNFNRPVTTAPTFVIKDSSSNVAITLGGAWTQIDPVGGGASTTSGVWENTIANPGTTFTVAENVQIDVIVDNLLATVKDSRTLSVLPTNTAAKLRVAEGTHASGETAVSTTGSTTVDVEKNVAKAITIQLADVHGNIVSPLANTSGLAYTVAGHTGGVEVRDANGLAVTGGTLGAGRNSLTLYVIDGDEAGSFTVQLGAGYVLTVNLK